MSKNGYRKLAILAGAFFGVWIFIRFLFPFFLPFLLGLALARWVNPAVEFLEKKICLPRWAAAGISVGLGFPMLFLLLGLPCMVLLRQLGRLTPLLPQVQETALRLLGQLESWLLTRSARAPASLRPLLEQGVAQLFSGGNLLMHRFAQALPGLAAGLVGRVADWAVQLGTAFLAAMMISLRLPRLRAWTRAHLPRAVRERYLPMLRTLRFSLLGWLRAQLLLSLAAGAIVFFAFWLLGIYPLWAFAVALVDAVPMLGTGTVLIPWSLLALAQGNRLRFWGLLLTYAAASVCRSVLEPKLLGKSMGLDPLAALAAVYVGLRLWGVAGMLLLPLAASCAVQLGRMNGGRNF